MIHTVHTMTIDRYARLEKTNELNLMKNTVFPTRKDRLEIAYRKLKREFKKALSGSEALEGFNTNVKHMWYVRYHMVYGLYRWMSYGINEENKKEYEDLFHLKYSTQENAIKRINKDLLRLVDLLNKKSEETTIEKFVTYYEMIGGQPISRKLTLYQLSEKVKAINEFTTTKKNKK